MINLGVFCVRILVKIAKMFLAVSGISLSLVAVVAVLALPLQREQNTAL